MSDTNKTTETEVAFAAKDGVQVAGRLLLPAKPETAVLISSATGFPKDFYLPFARYGAARGAVCLVYDYRGVRPFFDGKQPRRLTICAGNFLTLIGD